mmetsp:Transcript_50926/g.122777  ORF Transcript_50926/g.122777 Transcript_50926/m.122777 type:complete len:325 (-) Transcript_50926:349-1323(-)
MAPVAAVTGNEDTSSSSTTMMMEMMDSNSSSSSDLRSFLDILQQGVAATTKLTMATARPIIMKIVGHRNIFCGYDQAKSIIIASINGAPDTTNGVVELSTLDLFSYGTIKDYTANPTMYMTLNDQAVTKLAQLTVMSCIQDSSSKGKMGISYQELAHALGWDNTTTDDNNDRRVVDVLIQCVYADVLRGKLCQKTKTFSWVGQPLPVVLSRDVPQHHTSNLLTSLRGLEGRLAESVDGLKKNESVVLKKLEDDAKYWNVIQERRSKAQADGEAKSMMDLAGGFRGGPGGGMMGGGGTGGGGGGRHAGGPRSSKRSRGVVDAFRM